MPSPQTPCFVPLKPK